MMLPHAGLVLLAATQLGTAVAQGVVPSPTSGPTLESCEKVRERTGPPPNVLSARFTSTGENILVELDAASDNRVEAEGGEGRWATPPNCEELPLAPWY